MMKTFLLRAIVSIVGLVATAAIAITFSGPVQIVSDGNLAYAPRLAAGGANQLHMVWPVYFEAAGDVSGGVYYSRSADNGASWTAAQNLSNRVALPDYAPHVVASGSTVHVFWGTEPNAGGGQILYRRSTNGGQSFEAARAIASASGYARLPHAAIAADGRIHVVWYENSGTGAGDVYYAASCDGGTTFGASSRISRFEGFVDSEHGRITVATDGTVYVAIRSSREGNPQGGWPPYVTTILRGTPGGGCGVAWGAQGQTISASFPDQYSNAYSPNLIAGPGNSLFTAWWDEKKGADVVFRKGFPQESGFAPPQRLTDFGRLHNDHNDSQFELSEPVLASDGGAKVAVVYHRNVAKSGNIQYGDVQYRESNDGGNVFDAPVVLSSQGLTPGVLIANGRVHVAYAELNPATGLSNIVYRSALAGPDPNADDDGDGVPNGIEAQEGLNPAVKDNDVFANTAKGRRLFVMQMHRDLYYREATASEIAAGVNALTAGTTRAALADQLMSAPEHEDLVGPQVRLYFAYFLRLPDYGGLSFWVTQYRTRPGSGWSFEGISEFFSLSDEFKQRYGALSTDQFVTLIYNNVLSRAPEPGGFAFWTSELNSGRRIRGNVMAAFSEAPENKLLKTADVRVVASYFGLLRAMPDQASFNSWTAQIKGGTSSQVLLGQLIANPAYRARFLP